MSSSYYYDDGELVVRTFGAGATLYLMRTGDDYDGIPDGAIGFDDLEQMVATLRHLADRLEADALE